MQSTVSTQMAIYSTITTSTLQFYYMWKLSIEYTNDNVWVLQVLFRTVLYICKAECCWQTHLFQRSKINTSIHRCTSDLNPCVHWLDQFYMITKVGQFLFLSGNFCPPTPTNLCLYAPTNLCLYCMSMLAL